MNALPRNPLTNSEAIAANRRGEITYRQRVACANVWQPRGQVEVAYWFIGVLLVVMLIYGALTAQPHPSVKVFTYPVLALFAIPGVWVAGRSMKYLVRRDRAKRELSANQIESAVGNVVWTGSRYAAWVPTRAEARGWLFFDQALELAPGPYRFHFLPRSGWLLSAERLAVVEDNAEDDLLTILMGANDLDLEALSMNRAGQMTEAQRTKLRREFWTLAALFLVFELFFGFMVFVVWRAPNPLWVTVGLWVALVAMGLFIAYFGWREVQRIAADLHTGTVHTAQGLVRKQMFRHLSSRQDSYYYRLGDLRLAVSEVGYDALIEDRPYRLYYLPHTKRLLSLEPLPTIVE